MIQINRWNRDLDKLSKKHLQQLTPYLLDLLKSLNDASYKCLVVHGRTKNALLNVRDKLDKVNKEQINSFVSYLLEENEGVLVNLTEIILCPPTQLSSLYNSLATRFSLERTCQEIRNGEEKTIVAKRALLERIFNYDALGTGIVYKKCKQGDDLSYNSFDLIRSLDVSVCPYCNRQYISYIEDEGKQYKPDLDHFYPRSKYPIFGISFYNLIPSCSYCNSKFKLDLNFTTDSHIHPYQRGFESDAQFKYIIDKHDEKIVFKTELVIENDPDSKIKNSVQDFRLKKLYELHSDLAEEIFEKALEENDDHFNSLMSVMKDINPNREDFYKFYFGNYAEEKDFEKRPLSKFTRDLVDDLGILKKAGLE